MFFGVSVSDLRKLKEKAEKIMPASVTYSDRDYELIRYFRETANSNEVFRHFITTEQNKEKVLKLLQKDVQRLVDNLSYEIRSGYESNRKKALKEFKTQYSAYQARYSSHLSNPKPDFKSLIREKKELEKLQSKQLESDLLIAKEKRNTLKEQEQHAKERENQNILSQIKNAECRMHEDLENTIHTEKETLQKRINHKLQVIKERHIIEETLLDMDIELAEIQGEIEHLKSVRRELNAKKIDRLNSLVE